MRLYYHRVSNTSRPVVQLLEEQAIDYVPHEVDILSGGQFQSDFLAINPSHKVPVLVDGDVVLTESSAILKYIADKYELTQLYPPSLAERACVNERMDWFNTQFYQSAGYRLVYPQILEHICLDGFDSDANRNLLEVGATETAEWLTLLDTYILGATNPWVCGQTKTIADHLGAGHTTMLEWIGQSFGEYPNIGAWLERCKGPVWDRVQAAHNAFSAANSERSFRTA